MNNQDYDTLDQAEEEILAAAVSDEALETMANPAVASVTMGPGSCYVPGGMIC